MRVDKRAVQPQQGFTLIELITTMAVGVILVGFAVPSMTTFMRNHRVLTVADSFNTAVSKARSIAATTNSYVTVAPIGNDWKNGWQVFSEGLTPNGTYEEGTENLIAQYDKPPSDVVVTTSTFPTGLASISFSPVGYSQTTTKSQMSMSAGFQIGDAKRVVEVSLLGRARVCDPNRETSCVLP
ncbi:GspH/FimT family pseudopilin [Cupriavidus sp. KB_39]|jgi:type IV fimbrial biogenesis protein FimT|uniref:GspH/FimT family pseudopilin n=2 Tax=Bacteria TaxID=2 RepID=UPI003F925840